MKKIFVNIKQLNKFLDKEGWESYNSLIKSNKIISNGIICGFVINLKEFPELKSKLPTLWTRSYYCESVGHISEDIIKKYIEDQKGK